MTATRSKSPQSPDATDNRVPYAPWLTVGAGLSVISLCAVATVFSTHAFLGFTGPAVRSVSIAEAFGTPATGSPDGSGKATKLLTGIGGETFSPGISRVTAEADRIETPHGALDVAPVAWDRLSAGDCIMVTSQSGQTFSFRIVGARAPEQANPADVLPKIDLVITACANMGEPAAKAVIQSTPPQAQKGARAERSL